MEFKKGDRVRVNPTTYERLYEYAATGKGFLPGRMGRSERAVDFSAIGTVIGFGTHQCPYVRWDDYRWGLWFYDAEFLMPVSTAGF